MPRSSFDQGPDPAMFAELPELAANGLSPDGKLFDQPKIPAAPGEPDLDYESRVKGIIDDAREFNAEVLAPLRERGIQFYLGLVPELDEEGRSTIVATEVRDTVLAMLPSLMRIFTSQESTVLFLPQTTADVDKAEQACDYIGYVYQYDNDGYTITMDVMKDALIKGMGCVMWWTDDNLEMVEERYERLSLEQRQFVISDPTVKVIAMQSYGRPAPQPPAPGPPAPGAPPPAQMGAPPPPPPGGMAPPSDQPNPAVMQPAFDIVVRREKRAPKHRVCAVPPDEFRINRTATCIKDAACVGREWFMTQSELIRRGVERDLIAECADFSGGDLRFTSERMLRNPGSDSPFGRDVAEPVARYGEYWIRIDKDDDGIAELRHICVIGDNQTIVSDEPASRAKMAIACPDPEPHSIVGHSVSELVADLQVIKSNMLRGALDSLAQTIYPRLVGVDTLVDWDDVLNTAIGAPIKVKDVNALTQLKYDFVGQPVFTMMDRLDAIRMARTGITEQSKGLDPKALQSTTVKGIEMVITGAQERIELVARTMASTFMVDLWQGLLQEVTEKPVPERVVKLRGKYVEVNPDQFDQTMSCVVNGALGHGSDSDRFVMLNTVLAKQELIISQMGPMNPMVTPVEYRNTIEDLLNLAGMRNTSRYFKPVTPETVQQYLQQKQQQQDADPNVIYAKAQADKVKADIVKTMADARVKVEDLSMKDDRERDKVEGDQMLKAAEIDAKYGAAVDTAAIRTLWTAPRVPPQSMESGGGSTQATGGPPEAGPPPPVASPDGGGSAAKPPLPDRTALGAGPPQLPQGMPHGPPPGLLGPAGPGAGGGVPPRP